MKRQVLGLITALMVAAASAAPAQEKPLYGGTFIVGLAGEPQTLNITMTTDLPVSVVASNIFNKLLSLGPKEEVFPELATSWTASPDGLSYTFKLAQGVTWHDGKPFSSADVKFSLETLTKAFHPLGASMFEKVAAVETPDQNTVVIKMKTPYEPFLGFLALRAYILPKHLYENTDVRTNPANVKPVGTGPYKFTEWQRGSHITLEKNQNYFIKGQPYLDRFVYRIVPDPAARVLALETGDVDYVGNSDLPVTAIPNLQKNKNLTVSFTGSQSIAAVNQLFINHDRKPFNDVRVRRAISYAVDRKFIIDRAAQGMYAPATGPINSDMWSYSKDVATYPYDRAKAESLLDEAGLKKGPDGVRFRTEILAPRGRDEQVKAAEIIAQQLSEIGIATTFKVLDTAALSDVSYIKRDYDLMVNVITNAPDPAVGVQRQFMSNNIRPVPFTNAAGYRNPEVDRLFLAAENAPTREARMKPYSEIQKILTEDAVVVWLWEANFPTAWRSDFKGINDWSTAGIYYLSRAWWTKGKPAP